MKPFVPPHQIKKKIPKWKKQKIWMFKNVKKQNKIYFQILIQIFISSQNIFSAPNYFVDDQSWSIL